EAKRYSYPWVQTQLGLEESVCSGLMGDLGAHQKAARRALERAQEGGYGGLYLRALGFVTNGKFETGDRLTGWKLVSAGLERYWSGQFSATRGYNLYYVLAVHLGHSEQPHLSVAIWREASALIDSDEDLLLRAWAHSYMANAATAAHQPEIAEQQYAEAARL